MIYIINFNNSIQLYFHSQKGANFSEIALERCGEYLITAMAHSKQVKMGSESWNGCQGIKMHQRYEG